MNSEVRKQLENMGEQKYGEFSSALIPGAGKMIGIRIPRLRELAKKLARTEGVSALNGDDIWFEETMLRGMIIGYVKISTEERLLLIKDFIPLIDNWSICDSFCCTLKFAKKNQNIVWEFLQQYIRSDKEFEQRFAEVMMLDYFVNEDYIEKTLDALAGIDTDAYYSSMAAAWTLAECFIKFPQQTRPFIIDKRFDKDTHNRAIQKICDSYRVSNEVKQELKLIRMK